MKEIYSSRLVVETKRVATKAKKAENLWGRGLKRKVKRVRRSEMLDELLPNILQRRLADTTILGYLFTNQGLINFYLLI